MYNSFFGDILNDSLLGFGRPTRVIFNTNGIKDLNPSIWSKTEKGYKATVKTLGIESADVEIIENGIKVSGKNEIDGKKYDTTIELPIAEDVMNNVLEIRKQSIAGITIIELIVDKIDKKEIKIVSK